MTIAKLKQAFPSNRTNGLNGFNDGSGDGGGGWSLHPLGTTSWTASTSDYQLIHNPTHDPTHDPNHTHASRTTSPNTAPIVLMVRVEGWSGMVVVMDMRGVGMGVECHRRVVLDVTDLKELTAQLIMH